MTKEQLVEYVKIRVSNGKFVYGTVREPYVASDVWDFGGRELGHVIITRAQDKQVLSNCIPYIIHMRARPNYYSTLVREEYLIPLNDLEIIANYDKIITLEEYT